MLRECAVKQETKGALPAVLINDWDEYEFCGPDDEEDISYEQPVYEMESDDGEAVVTSGFRSDEGKDLLGERLLESWKNSLDVEELRDMALEVFGNVIERQQVLEVNLAMNTSGQPMKSIRAVYGTIIGLDLQSNLLIMQAGLDVEVLVVECSFTIEDTYLLEEASAKGTNAIKMIPIAICPITGSVLVEIDVDGLRLLRFAERNNSVPLIGIIAKVEEDGFVITLSEGM